MKVLITGGSGLVGGRVAEYLKTDNEVTISSRSKHISKNKINIIHNDLLLKEIGNGYDTVIHAAGPNSKQCEDQLSCNDYMDITSNLIKSCKKYNVKKFIFTSSTRIYGKNLINSIDEDTELSPDDGYSCVKREIEEYLRATCCSCDMQGYSLRISNGYGYPVKLETDCWNLLLMHVCREAILHSKVVLNSNGKEYKDFVPLNFIVKAIETCMKQDTNNSYLTYNIVSGKSLTVREAVKYLIDRIEVCTGEKIIFSTSNSDDDYKGFQINSKFSDSVSRREINHELDLLIEYCLQNFKPLN